MPRLADVVQRPWAVAELAELLAGWHHEHARAMGPEMWPEFYARRLLSLRNPGNQETFIS